MCCHLCTTVYTFTHGHQRRRQGAASPSGRRHGVVTAADAVRQHVHSQHLTRLVREGVLERIARGQYRIVGRPITEHHGLVIPLVRCRAA